MKILESEMVVMYDIDDTLVKWSDKFMVPEQGKVEFVDPYDTSDLLAALERGDEINKQTLLIEASSIAWRALAFSQQIHEKFGAPLAPAAKE